MYKAMHRLVCFGFVVALPLFASLSAPAQVASATGSDMHDMMMNLMESMRLQQKSINDLTERMNSTDRQIQDLRELIQQQNTAIEEAKQNLEKTQTALQEGGGGVEGYRATDEYAAELQFKNAYSVQHIAYFDVRRKDQGPYIRQAVKEFERVVERYPKTRWADESQVRIARLYRKIDENAEAVKAYRKLIEMFPDSEYVDEANERIGELSH